MIVFKFSTEVRRQIVNLIVATKNILLLPLIAYILHCIIEYRHLGMDSPPNQKEGGEDASRPRTP